MRPPQRTLAIACVLGALALVVLDAAITNIGLPAIAGSLQVTPAEAVRVMTAYQMALVMALLPCAALGESVGYRRVYTAGIVLFVLAAALCARAPSLAALVAARFLQGLGAAAVMSLGVALLRLIVPQRDLGRAIGWNALVVALSSASGPTVGAMVLSVASWRWMFAVSIPVGVLVLVATRALPAVPGSARKLDHGSVLLNGTAFAALVVGADLAPRHPAQATLLLVGAASSMVALVRRELPKQAPMVPLDLLRDHSFRISVIASVCCFAGQSAALVSLPFYLQHGLGQDALQSGLVITAWPLAVAVVAPVAGRLAGRISGAWLCAAGGAALAMGLALASLWPLHGRPFTLVPFVTLCGVGFGLFQVPNNRNMLLSAPRARSAAAGGMQGTARLTGQTLGAVVMTLLFTTTSIDLAPRIGLGSAALLTLAAGLVSVRRRALHAEFG